MPTKKRKADDLVLITGSANQELARQIGKILKTKVTNPISIFSDGEIRVRIEPNLRRKSVYIIQPTSSPVNDHIMELVFMADAARRASASEVIAVIPYFGYSRQDRKEMSRVPISSSVVSSMLTNAGVDKILTLDIHSEQQLGSIAKPWDNLFGSYALVPILKKRKFKYPVIASPDKGGVLRAAAYARLLQAQGIAIVYKRRDIQLNNVSGALDMIGEVADKDVFLIDDMIDTAGTIVHAAELLKKRGARKIRVAATHGLFSGDALEKIRDSVIEEVIVTDSIAQGEAVRRHPKLTIVTVAPLLAYAIKHIQRGEPLSKDLIG